MAKKKKEPVLTLVYPVQNKVLRFIGDVLLLVGSWVTNLGLKWGGVYELEDE